MQILVLGMHRSGTSAVTRLLGLHGCWLGGPEDFAPPTPDNPRGYWENMRVHRLDEALLEALEASWQAPPLEPEEVPAAARADFAAEAAAVVAELDEHRPWALKDPRMSVLLPLWREVLERPMALIVWRQPLEVALSLRERDSIPLSVGVALWEVYNLALLRDSRGLARTLVSYGELMHRPTATVGRLLAWLEAEGGRGLQELSAQKVEAFVEPTLYRALGDPELQEHYLNPQRRWLLDGLTDGSVLGVDPPPPSADALELIRLHWDRHEPERRAVAVLQQHVDELDRERRDAQEMARDLAARHEDAEQDRRALRRETEALDTCLQAAVTSHRQLEARFHRRGDQLSALEGRVERQRDQLSALEGHRAALEESLAAARGEVEALLRSRTYRLGQALTAPLRLLRRLLGGGAANGGR